MTTFYSRLCLPVATLTFAIFLAMPFLGCEYDQGFLKFPFFPDSLQWVKVSTFGILMAGSFLAANFFAQKEFFRLKLDPTMADTIVILAIVGGVSGSKLFFLFESWNEWSGWSEMWARLFSGGGLTWYGGLLLVMLLIYFYSTKVMKISFLYLSDILVPALAIGYAVGRLGCVASGDGCYGIQCPYSWPAPFAMAFPHGANPWHTIVNQYGDSNVIVYNTPLFESIFSLCLFLFFWAKKKVEWISGSKLFCFLAAHSIFRFFIEFIRRNPKDIFGITQAQLISLFIFISFLIYIFYKRNEIMHLMKKNTEAG